MDDSTPSEQAVLLHGARSSMARHAMLETRNIMAMIALLAAAAFVLIFSLLYAFTAPPALPEFQMRLACKRMPPVRTVIVAASSAKEAYAAMKAEMPECDLAPKAQPSAS